jgi:hypothetical protein
MHDIMHGKGKESLSWLLGYGFTLDDKALAGGLEIAVKMNEADAAEFLLARGASMDAARRLPTMIDMYAEPATIDAIEKWIRRDEVKPAGNLNARVAATDAAQAIALGVEAAYADVFGGVMQKLAEEPARFDPAVLCLTKDAYGNSILDILGAHGKLSDILIPELWRDKDAVAFIRDNTPACYQGQCDFNGLKAGLDQLRLKDLGRRARIGLKGP